MTWSYSPDPAVEAAVATVWRDFPPLRVENLARFERYLHALGNPHLRLPPVFHAAGTNGKGSTLAFLQAVLEAAGKSVHKFTSPHLVRFEERIVLNGKMIDSKTLCGLVDECVRAARGHEVSFFEFFTALSFLAFSRAKADAVLLETGLGGLLDSTNVVKDSVAVLTRISFDHTQVLGHTLPAIAAQKAGIIKPGCPAVSAPQPGDGVMAVFEKDTAAKGAALFTDWRVSPGFVYESPDFRFRLPPPALPGAHQLVNAGTAIAALEKSLFRDVLTQKNLEAAMRNVRWPGRLQKLAAGPMVDLLPSGWEIWIDGAHNDSGAEVLAAQLKDWDAPVDLVTAMKEKKDATAFYATLAPFVSSARVLDAALGADTDLGIAMVPAVALCDSLAAAGIRDARVVKNLESAVAAITSQQGGPRRILVAGSLYLAGYVLRSHS